MYMNPKFFLFLLYVIFKAFQMHFNHMHAVKLYSTQTNKHSMNRTRIYQASFFSTVTTYTKKKKKKTRPAMKANHVFISKVQCCHLSF